jgi:uncharacterized protein (TIGR00369 family)
MTDPVQLDSSAAANGRSPERTLTVSWEDPVESAMKLRGMSGIEAIRGIASGELPAPPIARLLGFGPEVVEEGHVIFGAHPGEQHYNPIGVVHGGLAATLLDSAMGCSVQTTLKQGEAYTTLELKVNFVRAITRDTGRVVADASVVHRGGRVATAEGRLMAEDSGKLLAHATTTCMVMSVG